MEQMKKQKKNDTVEKEHKWSYKRLSPSEKKKVSVHMLKDLQEKHKGPAAFQNKLTVLMTQRGQ